MVPKTACLADPERVAMAVIGPVRAFTALFRPFVSVLERRPLREVAESDNALRFGSLLSIVATHVR